MQNAGSNRLPNQQYDGDDEQTFKLTSDEPIHFREVTPAAEFLCWVSVLLFPILRLINGPAVTADQFLLQVALFSLALIGAIALRLISFFGGRKY